MTAHVHIGEWCDACVGYGIHLGIDAAPSPALTRDRAELTHPDANDSERNHYDWFMPPDGSANDPEWLDAFEAKLTEALTDPFVHDMAHSVLPLIRDHRKLLGPEIVTREEALAARLSAGDKAEAPPTGFVMCPLCGDPERVEDIVGGVCLTCADAIAFSQNARRGAVTVTPDPRYDVHGKNT